MNLGGGFRRNDLEGLEGGTMKNSPFKTSGGQIKRITFLCSEKKNTILELC